MCVCSEREVVLRDGRISQMSRRGACDKQQRGSDAPPSLDVGTRGK
jgi:hypothetical protein